MKGKFPLQRIIRGFKRKERGNRGKYEKMNSNKKKLLIKAKRDLIAFYDRVSSKYDTAIFMFYTRLLERCEERVTNRLLELLHGRGLDAGCGTGRYMKKICSNKCSVIGIDISTNMVKKTIQNLTEDQKPFGSVIVGDFENLPFKERTFDFVICTLAINHSTSLEKVIDEFSKVLRSGGLLIMSLLNGFIIKKACSLAKFPKDFIPFFTGCFSFIPLYEKCFGFQELQKTDFFKKFSLIRLEGACLMILILLLFPIYIFLRASNLDKKVAQRLLKYAELHVVVAKRF